MRTIPTRQSVKSMNKLKNNISTLLILALLSAQAEVSLFLTNETDENINVRGQRPTFFKGQQQNQMVLQITARPQESYNQKFEIADDNSRSNKIEFMINNQILPDVDVAYGTHIIIKKKGEYYYFEYSESAKKIKDLWQRFAYFKNRVKDKNTIFSHKDFTKSTLDQFYTDLNTTIGGLQESLSSFDNPDQFYSATKEELHDELESYRAAIHDKFNAKLSEWKSQKIQASSRLLRSIIDSIPNPIARRHLTAELNLYEQAFEADFNGKLLDENTTRLLKEILDAKAASSTAHSSSNFTSAHTRAVPQFDEADINTSFNFDSYAHSPIGTQEFITLKILTINPHEPWTAEDIKRSYRRRSKAAHPDKLPGDDSVMKALNSAKAYFDRIGEERFKENLSTLLNSDTSAQ